MDHVRQDSARIFAELIEGAKNPERVEAAEGIGSKPALFSRDELIGRLKDNRNLVKQMLAALEADRFTDPEVDLRYDTVRTFYITLFDFEEIVLEDTYH